jgi:hypothetical protein
MTVKQLANDLGVAPDEVIVALFVLDAPGINWASVMSDSFETEVPLGYNISVAKKMIEIRNTMIKDLQKGDKVKNV